MCDPQGGQVVYLSLEVEQLEGLEFDGGLGPQVSSQRAREVLQLSYTMGDTSLQSGDTTETRDREEGGRERRARERDRERERKVEGDSMRDRQY